MGYYLKFSIFLVRFLKWQDSYDVKNIVSHMVAVFLANIYKKRVNRCCLKSFKQFLLNKLNLRKTCVILELPPPKNVSISNYL